MIVIKICKENKKYKVSIENSGMEIPKEKQHKIFDKFYQADESHSSAGNGIGLSIVKSVIDLHGGQISVKCENGITTFCVEIAAD
jgi:signal transduction histidine kinase